MNKRKKKKMWIIIISILGVIVIGASGVLITATVMGRPVQINVDRQLAGVDEEIENVFYHAGFAPSSHNAQMWGITISPTTSTVSISLNDERLLKVVDPTSREAYISIGCYVETLKQTFAAYGYETTIHIKDALDEKGDFVKIIYKKIVNSTTDQKQLDNILKRHTDKSKYNDAAINANTLDLLADKDNIFYYIKGEENFNYLKQGTIDAVTVQSADQAYRDELAEWMRFSDNEVLEKQDGLPAEQIGLKGIVKSFYYWTTNHESAKGDTFAAQGIASCTGQVENCSAFFVVTSENNLKSLVETGMDTMELWLKSASNNVSMQPLSAMMEASPFAENIQLDLGLDAPVQMILRAGITNDYGGNAGIRRDLATYITVIE